MFHNNDKVLLLILDGWGHGLNPDLSAISKAKTPFVDQLYKDYPNAELITHGEPVGLPAGQMGNSEVGHLNIGAGRIVFQELLRINRAMANGDLHKNDVFKGMVDYLETSGKTLHIMGLVSDGGVHSHLSHLIDLCKSLQKYDVERIVIHAFLDGRDTNPHGGLDYLKTVQKEIEPLGIEIASVIGRFYAMDRDKRWERVKLAYDLLVNGKGKKAKDIFSAIKESYDGGTSDEFVLPIVKVGEDGNPVAIIQPDDAVLCFNYRTDRCREISSVLSQEDYPKFEMKQLPLHYVTFTRYDEKFEGVNVVFEKENLKQTLGEVLSKAGKKQIRIAETEKYPHVTFFFSGGREDLFEGEERIVVPSTKEVETYDLKPEMSAFEIKEAVLDRLKKSEAHFICVNFANTDMVGHTGVFEAAIKAAEVVDNCTKEVVETALQSGYSCILIADHGNSDMMINPDGSPNTAHTTNLVPVILIGNELEKVKISNGKLGDVAPTILSIMGIDQPKEMDGVSLINK